MGSLIFDVIERVPEVKNIKEFKSEVTLTKHIAFQNVNFKYPTALPEKNSTLLDSNF